MDRRACRHEKEHQHCSERQVWNAAGAVGDGECWREQCGTEEGEAPGDQQAPWCRSGKPDDAEAEDAVQGDPLARERSAEQEAGDEEEEPARECSSRATLEPRHEGDCAAEQEGEQIDIVHADAALHKSGSVKQGKNPDEGRDVASFRQQPGQENQECCGECSGNHPRPTPAGGELAHVDLCQFT